MNKLLKTGTVIGITSLVAYFSYRYGHNMGCKYLDNHIKKHAEKGPLYCKTDNGKTIKVEVMGDSCFKVPVGFM